MIADDSSLVKLTSEPDRELLPVLNRAGGMAPLVIVCAFLPGLAALHHQTVDDVDAAWGLKSLSLAWTPPANGDGELDEDVAGSVLRYYPPLGTWLIAVSQHAIMRSWGLSLVLPSYLSMAGVVVMSWVLIKRLAGPRQALLAALMVACHGPLLAHSQDPAPHALGLLCALVTFWGFLSHLDVGVGLVSFRLLIGGVGLGACLLAGGPLAMVVLATLLFPVLSGFLWADRREHAPRGVRRRPSPEWWGLFALAVLALTGFAVGGWWVLRMASRHGLPFWSAWISGTADGLVHAPQPMAVSVFLGAVTYHLATMLGSLSGLAVLGSWCAGRRIAELPEEAAGSALVNNGRRTAETQNGTAGETISEKARGMRRLGPMFLLAWTVCGSVVWMSSLAAISHSAPIASLWQSFVLLPCIFLAAFAVDEILRRRVRAFAVVAATVGTIVIWAGTTGHESGGAEAGVTVLSVLALAVGLGTVVGWAASLCCRGRETSRRWLLAGCVAFLFVGNAILGVSSTQAPQDARQELRQFASRLVGITEVSSCTIVAAEEPPLRLRYVVASSWPDAALTIVTPPKGDTLREPEPATNDGASAQSPDSKGAHIVITWGIRTLPLTSVNWRDASVHRIAHPAYLENRELNVLGLTRRPSGR